MIRMWLRRIAAVAVLVGGLSFLGGPPAQAQELCMRLFLGSSSGQPQTCIPYPF